MKKIFENIKEIIKLLKAYYETKDQYYKDKLAISKIDLSEQALQNLVNNIKTGESEIIITIKDVNGRTIILERKKESKFKTFAEKFAEARAEMGAY